MNIVDIIIKKRDGMKLTKAEIDYFIQNYTSGEIPDYQASALVMAIMCRGMDAEETANLTTAMSRSGNFIALDKTSRFYVDKHSTGGVGDKTTLIVQPIVTACGISVAKMSGRGLGFSGGTIDKLESFPGMRLDLSADDFVTQLSKYGTAITGQSKDLAPADGKLYALRDVTGTVPSPALMASSIMSKKMVILTNAILLDVKVGKGAFMKEIEPARNLAKMMVDIGKRDGWIMKAELSDMNQPLGYAVGNILEVKEAISMLKCEPTAPDLYEHCVDSSAQLLWMSEKTDSFEEGKRMAEEALQNGQALEHLKLLIRVQGGDESYVDDVSKFPLAPIIRTVNAESSGYIHEIDAQIIGETSVSLGAGRVKKTDQIDRRVGIIVHHKVGDQVQKGDALFTIHANSEEKFSEAAQRISEAHLIKAAYCDKLPQFYGMVE